MSNQKKIEFNMPRKFGDKINVTFNYVAQNFKSLALSLIYILAPVMLIGGISYSYFFDWYFSLISELSSGRTSDFFTMTDIPVLIVVVLGFIIVAVFSVALIVSVVYSHMMIYKENELRPIPVSEVWERVKKEFSGILGLQIGISVIIFFSAIVLAGVLVGVPIYLEVYGLAFLGYLLLFVLLIYVSIALSMIYIIKVNEKLDFFDAIQRSIYLVKGKWWSTCGLLIIMQLIAGAMSYFFAIPMYIAMLGDMLHSIEEGGMPFESYDGMGITGIIFTTLYIFGSYILYALPFIAIAFQYFNLVELKEATGLMGKIDSLGEEKDTDDADEDY